MEKDEFKIKSYSNKELADHYGVSRQTFRSWIKRLSVDLGTRVGNYYSPRQVKLIVDQLGKPFVLLFTFCMKLFTRGHNGAAHLLDEDKDLNM